MSDPDCTYVVWVPPFGSQGLGNKILALASTFLYALLTNRVLYIAAEENMDQLFCEPFPKSSWLLPEPAKHMLERLNQTTTLGSGLKTPTQCGAEARFPPLAYSYLSVDHNEGDRSFFCEDMQDVLSEQVQWLFLRSNVYFVPGLRFVSEFREELDELFPHPQAMFHQLSRYLFHPSNSVWDHVAKYYESHLKQADSITGLQIRVTPHRRGKRKSYAGDVLQCALEKGLLPAVGEHSQLGRKMKVGRAIAGLLTSLDIEHFETFRDYYSRLPAVDGSSVNIYQPSHEGQQQTGVLEHDEKALMEIYLLSMSDQLITTPGSTFGYIAQGLGGLRPWLMRSGSGGGKDVCRRSSMEPCFFSFAAPRCRCNSVQNDELDVQSCDDAPGKKFQPL